MTRVIPLFSILCNKIEGYGKDENSLVLQGVWI